LKELSRGGESEIKRIALDTSVGVVFFGWAGTPEYSRHDHSVCGITNGANRKKMRLVTRCTI
jgi:hypothetical protein